MRKSNVLKTLGIVMAAVILGMVPASTAKADYTIHQEGFCLELEAPKGAILMENSYGEKVAYDANGNAIAKITASGYKIDYEYDVNGNMIWGKNKDGTEVWMEYDEEGNNTHLKTSDGYEEWFEYDKNGNIIRSKKKKTH